jgi:Dinucleotide-utilizing enzymes involved in molybdopterin and thiamine biosynthesis family 1
LIEPIALNVVPNNNHTHIFWDIALVGVGGTGGYVLQSFMRMLKNFDIEGLLTLADGDYVEENNLRRQNFIMPDVGKKKVDVLAKRYANVYDLDIRTIGDYLEDEKSFERLFTAESNYNYIPSRHVMRILIGAVDNNKSRQVMHRYFKSQSDLIYIDAGNDGVLAVSDSVTEDDVKESGYSGQVVVGLRSQGRTILDPIGDVYANILEEEENDFFPSQACGRTVVNHPQRMQTNLMSANVILGYLNMLLSEGCLVSHFTNFDARNQVMRPEYITQDMLSSLVDKAA